MADTFAELGLSERLAGAARAAGHDRPTPLQAAAYPVLRRGGNVVLHASSGAGLTLAWGLPLLDRLADGDAAADGPRALVLAPTIDRAARIADALAALTDGAGITVRPTLPGWHTAGADVVTTTPQRALADVQGSALKLESLEALVITDLAEFYRLGGDEALATLIGLVPRDAQRVVTSGELNTEVERFVEAQVRKAMSIPPRPADPTLLKESHASLGQIGYVALPEAEKDEILARLLDGVEESAIVYTRSEARADSVRRTLARRGLPGSDNVTVASFDGDVGAAGRIISYDVPWSADELRRLHSTGGTVFVTPAQLPHLQRIAKQVPFSLKHRRARALDTSALDDFRNTIRAAFDAEDLSSQMLVLEPLFDEYSPAEVAAALSALLRKKAPAQKSAAAPTGVVGAAPKEAQTGSGFTRLFISIGTLDNIRAGDLVGAITGEANIKGDQVGRIDIRESFSVVEVMASVADKVIRALNGTTMRGRSLRVDYDRKGGGGGGGDGPRGPGGPRGRSDRPPPRGDRPPPRGDRPPPRGDRPPPRGDRPRPPRRDG
ncbi:MAG TPA: DEAD/DEAH box helicase [Longimicrobiales bacterium]|nr:DEAD/DEAH box helicase [Longimicrobiales bacterium]